MDKKFFLLISEIYVLFVEKGVKNLFYVNIVLMVIIFINNDVFFLCGFVE